MGTTCSEPTVISLHLLENHQFETMRHDVTHPLFVEANEIYNLARRIRQFITSVNRFTRPSPASCARSTCPDSPNGQDSPGLNLGGATRIRSSQCQSDCPPGPAQRGQAPCREPIFRLLPVPQPAHLSAYGPRMHPNDGRIVSNFFVQALKGERNYALR